MRRRARARALQALYAWDIAGTGPLLDTTQRLWDDMAVGAAEREFATPLMRLVDANRETIDAQLADVTTNWRMERLGAIERSILRLGAAEFARPDVPGRVTIQESVRLAELFGSDESAKFVNGVLDALGRRLGRL
ncbi:MAG: transcription antitermination factor NusB [Gemmatimonadaceae bacterium]